MDAHGMAKRILVHPENSPLRRSLAGIPQEIEQRVEDRTRKLTEKVAQLRMHRDQLATLDKMATEISCCLSQAEVLETGLELSCRATGALGGAVWLAHADGSLELAGTRGLSEDKARELNHGFQSHPGLRGMIGEALPFLIELSDQQEGGGPAPARPSEARNLLVVPLVSRDGPQGALGLPLRAGAGNGRVQYELEQALGAKLGVALENARHYESLRYLADRDSLTGLLNHRALHVHLEHELARAQRSGGIFSLLMLDLDNFKLFNDTYGHPTGDQVLQLVGGLVTETARTSDVIGRYGGDEFMVVLPDTSEDGALEFAERFRELLREHPYEAREGLPFSVECSIGVASYPDDARKLDELVSFADTNLYNSKQQGGNSITAGENGERAQAKLRGAGMFAALDGLIAAIDDKDHYTRGHSEEVTKRSLAIADRLALSNQSERTLRIAGLLHDVGKIGIPESILCKPGLLSESELEVVKQHALLSELIVKDVPNVREVIAAVGSHHERWDGKGYPRGLEEEKIPLLGRILAVADAYSAMTTERPYRPTLSSAEALIELRRVAGSQLDPNLVGVFLSVLMDPAAKRRGA